MKESARLEVLDNSMSLRKVSTKPEQDHKADVRALHVTVCNVAFDHAK